MNIHKHKKIKKEREEAITLAHEKGDDILMRKLEKERDDAELEVTFWLLSLSFIECFGYIERIIILVERISHQFLLQLI